MLCFFTGKCARLYWFSFLFRWGNNTLGYLCGGERLSVYYLYAWGELSGQVADHYIYTSIRLIAYFVTEN